METPSPVFTTQPLSQNVVAGTQISFVATATGGTATTYQWHRNGSDIPGATESHYAIVTDEADSGSIWGVRAMNGVSAATSSQTATLIVTPAGPGITLLAGDRNAAWPSGEFREGTGDSARFFKLTALTVDRDGNVFVTDNETVRKITRHGVVTTIAGGIYAPGNADGPGRSARFEADLRSIGADAQGNLFALSGSSLRKISREGLVSTVATTDSFARHLAVDSTGNVYISRSAPYFINVWVGALFKVPAGGVIAPFKPGYDPENYFDIAGAPIAVNAQDQLFSLACGSNLQQRITRFDAQEVGTIVAESQSLCWRSFAVNASGNVYGGNMATPLVNNAVEIAKYAAPGNWIALVGGNTPSLPGRVGTVRGMAFGPDGVLYVIANNAVVKIRLP